MPPSAPYETIAVRPVTGVIGAEIRGVDLSRPLTPRQWEEIRRAYVEHLVIFFPDQQLDHAAHEAFSARFGELTRAHMLHGVEGSAYVQKVFRKATDTGRVNGESWHADGSYLERPYAAVVMRADRVPDFGGDTGFSNMILAYEQLSEGMRSLLEGRCAVHSATRMYGSAYHASKRRFDPGHIANDPALIAEGDREVVHSLVQTHPMSGRRHLYLNRLYVQRIDGMTEEESRPIIDYLCEHAARYEYTCRIRWTDGQVLVWDNRAVLHKAVNDYAGKERRMYRTTIAGGRPD
ncbi:MAG: TauD/TfdA dioxygenase family protein [Lautropia sp.]